MRFEDVRAAVTGAAGGLGRHFTKELARRGAMVAAVDVNEQGLKRLKAEVEEGGDRVFISRLDVSDEASVISFVSKTAASFGGINVLVNNAALLRDGLLAKSEGGWVRKLPTAVWKQVIDVNLTAPYLLAREVVADYLRRGTKQGLIVNISSISRSGNPGQSNYSASKAGLDACTRTWALELAPYGIRVGGIAPGLVDTPMLEHVSAETKASLTAGIPLGRIGTPHEIWLALKFIIECDYFTGRVIDVDGGSTF